MRARFSRLAILALLAASPALAQLGLPGVQVPGVPTGDILRGTLEPVRDTLQDTSTKLLELRLDRIARLVRQNRDSVELDAAGQPARKGEILAMDVSPQALEALRAAQFGVLGEEPVEGLGLAVTRLSLPPGVSLRAAGRLLSRVVPGVEWTPDHIYFASGTDRGQAGGASAAAGSIAAAVGVIDGTPGPSVAVSATKGFAKGAPYPSNHGSAIASLLESAGARRVLVADVYGRDPAGGNALAIAKGLGWLASEGVKVVTISLVGPKNPVLERAVGAAQRKGVVVVAAVGHGGPAAPPTYPASYEGVVAVTGVDKRNRALIEAGRALHLDYAAPGADIVGNNAKGKRVKLRGTSFAAPLAAARIAAALDRRSWRRALDAEAVDLGEKGPDPIYGRGLVCSNCR
jgi:hypothetical protein